MKHTPGPWHTYPLRYNPAKKSPVYKVQVRDSNENILAVTSSYGEHMGAPTNEKTIVANGNLLATAPDLLKALKEAYAEANAGNGETDATTRWPEWKKAIAKAEGRD